MKRQATLIYSPIIKIVIVVAIIAALGGVFFYHSAAAESSSERFKPSPLSEPKWMAEEPAWTAKKPCFVRSDEEKAQDKLALKVLETYSRLNPLSQAVIKNFGMEANYRYNSDGTINHDQRLCPAHDLSPALADAAIAKGYYSQIPLSENILQFTKNIEPHSPIIIEAVAKTAFYPDYADDNGINLRAEARVVLSQFGKDASSWGKQAFDAINVNDQEGAAAAYVAVATNYPGSLKKISDLMQGILDKYRNASLPFKDTLIFDMLADAITGAGSEAKTYIELIHRGLDHDVTSWSVVGMHTMKNAELCGNLKLIGGPEADAVLATPVCTDYESAIHHTPPVGTH